MTLTVTLEDQIKHLALEEGAVLVGICSADSIKEKEASDPNYLLQGAQSVVSIGLNLDDEKIKIYLSKTERDPFVEHQDDVYKKLKEIGGKIKIFLEEKGFKAVNCNLNFDYRNRNENDNIPELLENYVELIDKEKNNTITDKEKTMVEQMQKMLDLAPPKDPKEQFQEGMVPELSHKCVAVAAGLGRVGWSGNVVTEKYGARVLFNSIVTNAKLTPDKQLEENPCNNCKLCEKACQSGLFSRDETQSIVIAGVEEIIAKRYSKAYCAAVCGGMIGQNKFKEWSTWSPYRLKEGESLPKDDSIEEYVMKLMLECIREGGVRAKHLLVQIKAIRDGLHNKPKGMYVPTCACCQLVCGPTMKDKKESYNLLKNGGCIELGGKWDPEYCLK
ncbi:MAG: hypothetical protein ACTSPS_10695 [Promethearchaeota archaeon]